MAKLVNAISVRGEMSEERMLRNKALHPDSGTRCKRVNLASTRTSPSLTLELALAPAIVIALAADVARALVKKPLTD